MHATDFWYVTMNVAIVAILLSVVAASTTDNVEYDFQVKLLDGDKRVVIMSAGNGSRLILDLEDTGRQTEVVTAAGRHSSSSSPSSSLHQLGLKAMSGLAYWRRPGSRERVGSAVVVFDEEAGTLSGRAKFGGGVAFTIEEGGDKGSVAVKRTKRNDGQRRTFKEPLKLPEVKESRKVLDLSQRKRGGVCKMLVKVDHLLYESMDKDQREIAKYVVKVVEGVNDVYREQIKVKVGGGREEPVQFHVSKLEVATDDTCNSPHAAEDEATSAACNPRADDPKSLVAAFAAADYSDYCVSYLFSGQHFADTLGLSYIGGVCKDFTPLWVMGPYHQVLLVGEVSPNCGMVTVDGRLASDEAEYTLAHELGHSLGAPHDDDPSCFDAYGEGETGEEEDGGGGFLMAPRAPDHYSRQREVFSPCSKRAIQRNVDRMARGETKWCLVQGGTITAPTASPTEWTVEEHVDPVAPFEDKHGEVDVEIRKKIKLLRNLARSILLYLYKFSPLHFFHPFTLDLFSASTWQFRLIAVGVPLLILGIALFFGLCLATRPVYWRDRRQVGDGDKRLVDEEEEEEGNHTEHGQGFPNQNVQES